MYTHRTDTPATRALSHFKKHCNAYYTYWTAAVVIPIDHLYTRVRSFFDLEFS